LKPFDKLLVSKLVIAIVVKILVLLVLWWSFFHDQRVSVDAQGVTERLLAPSSTLGHPGESR
jgi:low temperature requirement protein LtrA